MCEALLRFRREEVGRRASPGPAAPRMVRGTKKRGTCWQHRQLRTDNAHNIAIEVLKAELVVEAGLEWRCTDLVYGGSLSWRSFSVEWVDGGTDRKTGPDSGEALTIRLTEIGKNQTVPARRRGWRYTYVYGPRPGPDFSPWTRATQYSIGAQGLASAIPSHSLLRCSRERRTFRSKYNAYVSFSSRFVALSG